MSEDSSPALRFMRSHGAMLIGCAVVAAFAFTVCRRAIILTDEGYLLSQVVDMLRGKVLYRDMDSFVAPGIWFLLAGLFKLVEPSVLSSRILSFAGYVGTLFVSYRIVTGLTSRGWGWATVGALMVLTMWSFPAWTLVFYSPFAILFGLVGLDFLLIWRNSQRARDLVLSGLFFGLSVAFKQNYGAFALMGALGALVAFRFERREPLAAVVRGVFGDGLRVGAGVGAVVLLVIGYFGYHGALGAIYESLVVHPFIFMGRHDIAFPALSMLWTEMPLFGVDGLTYGSFAHNQAPNPFFTMVPALSWLHLSRLVERLHVLLYWLPVLAFGVGALLALRPAESRRPLDGGLAAVLAVAFFVFLGVFPRADFNHLMNVYQPAVILGVVVVQRLLARWRRPLAVRAGMAVALGVVGLYGFVSASWYLHVLRAFSAPVGGERGGVLVPLVERNMLDFQVRAIRSRTRDGDFVLTVPALTMLNFLTDRPMPGRFYNMGEHHIAHDEGASVAEAAEAHGVDVVVTDYNNFFSDRVGLRAYAPKLSDYLRTHFEPELEVAGDRFRFLRRRKDPLEARARTDLIGSCEAVEKLGSYSREHLLFASLYQVNNPKKPGKWVDTFCTLKVPRRAELAVTLGYRWPAVVKPGSKFTAEVWLAQGDESEKLFAEELSVESPQSWQTPPAPEFRIDLTRFAGRELRLLFRSSFEGAARMGPFDLGGFALYWQDPRLEVRDDRVLLVGIDGATSRLIEPLMAAGRLPNLAAISRRGVAGALRSEHPILSPRIWTTMATGKVPRKHGIQGWVKKGADGGFELLLGTDRKVPALWNIATDKGFSSGVVNWLNSYPPEKIRGVMVSDFAIAGQREGRERMFARKADVSDRVDRDVTYPAEWFENVGRLSAEGGTLLDVENPFGDNRALPRWMNQAIPSQAFLDDDLVTRIALEIEREIRPDILMVYLSGIDKVSHNVWAALEPPELYPAHIRFSDAERHAAVSALESYYVYTDELIGKLLERFDADDLVLVVSDHGFEARMLTQWVSGGHDTDAALDGVLFASGRRIPANGDAVGQSINDITPTILAWLGLPTAFDMDGQVANFVDLHSRPKIVSYNDVPVEREGDGRAGVEDAIMDQLRDLGYVEE